MFTEETWTVAELDTYTRMVTAAPILTEPVLTRSNRVDYLATAQAFPNDHLFMDPNTGLRLKYIRGKKGLDYVFGEELVAIAKSRSDRLTMVFDQSVDRRFRHKNQIMAKLHWLGDNDLYGVAYLSHACFLLVSPNGTVLDEAVAQLLKRSGLPHDRILDPERPNVDAL